MDYLKQISEALIMLIRVGVIFRIVHSFIMIGASEEEAGSYKKRIRNAIIFYIAAELIWQIKDLIFFYYAK